MACSDGVVFEIGARRCDRLAGRVRDYSGVDLYQVALDGSASPRDVPYQNAGDVIAGLDTSGVLDCGRPQNVQSDSRTRLIRLISSQANSSPHL